MDSLNWTGLDWTAEPVLGSPPLSVVSQGQRLQDNAGMIHPGSTSQLRPGYKTTVVKFSLSGKSTSEAVCFHTNTLGARGSSRTLRKTCVHDARRLQLDKDSDFANPAGSAASPGPTTVAPICLLIQCKCSQDSSVDRRASDHRVEREHCHCQSFSDRTAELSSRRGRTSGNVSFSPVVLSGSHAVVVVAESRIQRTGHPGQLASV